jgi:uncharacterized protein
VRIRSIAAGIGLIGFALQAAQSSAELTASKSERVRELLAIVGVAGVSEQMLEQQSIVELMRIQPSYDAMMEFAVSEQRDLSEPERERLLARLADFDAFGRRFRSLFVERLNFSAIIESVYPPLYDQYFSDAELEQMLAFYRTPVGRKAIEVMPSLMVEAAQGVDRAVRPIAVGLIQQIVAEERAKLAE